MGTEGVKGVLDRRLAAQWVFMSAIRYVFVVVFISFSPCSTRHNPVDSFFFAILLIFSATSPRHDVLSTLLDDGAYLYLSYDLKK